MPNGDNDSISSNSNNFRGEQRSVNFPFAAPEINTPAPVLATGTSYYRSSSSNSNHPSVLLPFHNQNYHPPQFSYTNTTTLFPFSASDYTEHYYVPSVNGNERLAFARCPAQLVGPSERVENHNYLFLEQFRYAGVQQEYQPPYCNIDNVSRENLLGTGHIDVGTGLVEEEGQKDQKEQEGKEEKTEQKHECFAGPLIITTPTFSKTAPAILRADAPEFVPQSVIALSMSGSNNG
ncbi:hypothetical protein MPDQ_005520 [Monascus purpureus]|uniref:Uncharacterized protein n=1 Tax=Monascus purpureus TaxID=5098 RepID=A0A507R6Q9_MONPU|nr:hypothetical protein MPDQ_005520 [Monascus purpureus]